MTALAAIKMSLHFVAKFDGAISEGEEGVVRADAYILACDDAGAALADNNHASSGLSAVANLNAKKFRIGVRQVFSCSATFFCCHMFVYCA